MSQANEPKADTDALRDRLARLTRASLRVSESLDLTRAQQEIAENACDLTGTRHGSITAMDDSGEMGEFVLLGSTPEEQRGLLASPVPGSCTGACESIPDLSSSRISLLTRGSAGLPANCRTGSGTAVVFWLRNRGSAASTAAVKRKNGLNRISRCRAVDGQHVQLPTHARTSPPRSSSTDRPFASAHRESGRNIVWHP